MERRRLSWAVGPIAALILAACGGAVSDEYVREEPYSVETVDGDEAPRITLTESAVERLGIETAVVGSRGDELVVPYDAVFLDAHGDLWVYANPEPFVFVREPIDIVRETSDRAFLADGPPEGTHVVTVGVPELYGSETGFGT